MIRYFMSEKTRQIKLKFIRKEAWQRPIKTRRMVNLRQTTRTNRTKYSSLSRTRNQTHLLPLQKLLIATKRKRRRLELQKKHQLTRINQISLSIHNMMSWQNYWRRTLKRCQNYLKYRKLSLNKDSRTISSTKQRRWSSKN